MTKQPGKAKRPKRAVIPAGCKSIEEIYDILARDLGLPRHFGRNLDALYDTLTGDVEGPFEIVLEDAKALEAAVGVQGRPLLKLLRDVGKARRDVRLVFRPGAAR
jgi:ribonuclease inhibitor